MEATILEIFRTRLLLKFCRRLLTSSSALYMGTAISHRPIGLAFTSSDADAIESV